MSAIAMPVFTTDVISIKDLKVINRDKTTGKKSHSSIEVNGEELNAGGRFWNSLFSRYGFNQQFFKYFKEDEVFDRICNTEKNDKLRICVERNGSDAGRLLAVSNPTKPIADYKAVVELLEEYDGENFAYHDGEISTLHSPRIGGTSEISGDLFHNKFSINVPIDGYGSTSLYLAMLRQVCSNGAVAMSKAFRQSLQMGKGDDSVIPTLVRALDSYNNDEGFHALRHRIESSAHSWASVHEAANLYKSLVRMHLNDELSQDVKPDAIMLNELSSGVFSRDEKFLGSGKLNEFTPILSAYHKMTGDTTLLYGVANTDALSIKRQKALPVKCTMYDLINFATEVSTHHANPAGQRRLQGAFGTMVSNEYDLEGSKEQFGEFSDFMIGRKLSNGVTGSNPEWN